VNLKRLLKRSQEDNELVQELESHLQHEIDDNLARGMSTEEARRHAYVKLGNPLVIREKVWESSRISWLDDLWRDLRYAVRTLAKAPGFTCVVVLVMALGVGANASIFSFLDSVLLRSLPVSDPASLVVVNWHAKPNQQDFVMQEMSGTTDEDNNLGMVSGILPYHAFELFQTQSNVFSDIFGYCRSKEVRTLNVLIKGQAEVAAGELVTGAYFSGLSVVPAAGRVILPDDDRAGAPPVAVVSYGFSEKYLGGHANAAGQSVQINNLPFTVVGVAPPEFFGVDPSAAPDVYLPMHTNVLFGAQIPFGFGPADYLNANYYWLEIMARLRPGVTLEQAQAKIAPQFQLWVATTAHNDAQKANLPVLYLREGASGIDTLRRHFSKPLYLLMTLVILILAIACSNIANLLLSRAAFRKREIALRISQGASRFRVIRQLLTESIVLSSLGGSIGVLLAVFGIRVFSALLVEGPKDIAVHAELNWHVLLVAAFLSVLIGILFGLAPALQSTHLDLVSSLKESQTRQARPHHRFGRISAAHLLVIGQIAISLLILVAAGLFVRTLTNLQSVNLGFNRENVLLFELNARQAGHHDTEISEFYAHLRDRFAAIPGVRQVSLADSSLLTAGDGLPVTVPGKPPRDDTRFIPVGPEFLTTMQIPLVAGRDFSLADRLGSQAVAVINEEFARINFPNEDPLGRHLFLWKAEADEEIAKGSWNNKKNVARDMEIVGIAKNANYGGVKQKTPPVVYLAYDQGYPEPNEMVFALRSWGDPLSYVNSVREVVHQEDPRLPLSDVRTQKAEIETDMHLEIMLAELCAAFAVLALAIACVGLYGTISYAVTRRTGELGIRMALGATRTAVFGIVLREVFLLAAIGLAISFPVALATSKFIRSFLFGIKPNDPAALAFAVIILLVAALLAGGMPAKRAASIEPMTALRHE
jgi:macrolide transport system ATP-binding/permease protein